MKRTAIEYVQNHFGLSERKACRVLAVARTTARYKNKPNDDDRILGLIKAITAKYPRYGCSMIYQKLRQTGLVINHKRIERLYREYQLQLRNRKQKRKFIVQKREEHLMSEKPGQWLAMDFVIDRVANRRTLKVLTVVDPVTNEVPILYPEYSLRGADVAGVLESFCSEHGYPRFLQCDNGPEFRSFEVNEWSKQHGVQLVYSRPGKPTDNCFCERFNGTLRNECLNVYYFETLADAKQIIENWRLDYNNCRPQKRFNGLTPSEYKRKILEGNLN